VIASTGLRKGEPLALRWGRIDLDARTLKVAATIARVNHALMIT
jgi:integrase